MALEQELKTFEDNKAQLLKEKKGRFVLVKGNEFMSDFASYEDALTDGYKRFGNQEFLVKQVLEVEKVNLVSREVLV